MASDLCRCVDAFALSQCFCAHHSVLFEDWPPEGSGTDTGGTAVTGLPAIPTTKILAIGHVTSKSAPDGMRSVMPHEVKDTIKLYLAGKIDQWFARKDKPGVVFVLNVQDVAEAREMLSKLPL